MSRFAILDTPLSGLKIIERQELKDSRGSLSRLFCNQELASCGWQTPIAQINHTVTLSRGTIRGMHFQHSPHSEMKLVSCLRGEVWDVAVDIRSESPTFLQYHAVFLSPDNHLSLLIPKGFAHGFQTITDNVELLYCHSTSYNPKAEGGLNPKDPMLLIEWPVAVTAMSDRDRTHPPISQEFKGIRI